MLVLITVQANIPAAVFSRGQGYEPLERLISVVGGVGTTGSSLLGAVGLSLSLPATAYTAGPMPALPQHGTGRGPLIWGPLFSFAITLSELTLFGFGPFFCAIVGGIGVSLLVERPALRGLHASS